MSGVLTTGRIVVGILGLSLLLASASCGDEDGGGDDDSAADTDTDGDTDVDTDVDTDTDADGGTDTGSDTGDPCEGDCENLVYTECTCATDDPCDWAEDGFCDGFCFEGGVVEEMFDDLVDCPGECTGLCDEVEWTIHYLPCTCHPDDTCEWAGNGICDQECVDGGAVTEMFDDSADCAGDAGVDAG